MEKVEKYDFIEVDYTGKLTDGLVFDTTKEKVAKEHNLHAENRTFNPAKICVGEGQLLPGLDEQIVGQEVGKEFTIKLNPEKAFGKRDIKKMKIVPSGSFKEHKVEPYPGLQIDMDGEMGTITRVSGGRVIVNFNHPLAGKEVIYEVNILRKITDPHEKIISYLNTTLHLPANEIKVEIKEDKATVEIPLQLPPQFTNPLGKRIAEITQLKEVVIKAQEKKEKSALQS